MTKVTKFHIEDGICNLLSSMVSCLKDECAGEIILNQFSSIDSAKTFVLFDEIKKRIMLGKSVEANLDVWAIIIKKYQAIELLDDFIIFYFILSEKHTYFEKKINDLYKTFGVCFLKHYKSLSQIPAFFNIKVDLENIVRADMIKHRSKETIFALNNEM